MFRHSTTPPEQILAEILCCAKQRDLVSYLELLPETVTKFKKKKNDFERKRSVIFFGAQ